MLTEVNYEAQTVELMRALQQGRKLEAIKAFKALTGYGLKESKDQVEATMTAIQAMGPPAHGSYVVIDLDHDPVIHRNYWDAADEARRVVTGKSKQLIARVTTQVRANIVEESYGQ